MNKNNKFEFNILKTKEDKFDTLAEKSLHKKLKDQVLQVLE